MQTEAIIRRKSDGMTIAPVLRSVQHALDIVQQAAPENWQDLYDIEVRFITEFEAIKWEDHEL